MIGKDDINNMKRALVSEDRNSKVKRDKAPDDSLTLTFVHGLDRIYLMYRLSSILNLSYSINILYYIYFMLYFIIEYVIFHVIFYY